MRASGSLIALKAVIMPTSSLAIERGVGKTLVERVLCLATRFGKPFVSLASSTRPQFRREKCHVRGCREEEGKRYEMGEKRGRKGTKGGQIKDEERKKR